LSNPSYVLTERSGQAWAQDSFRKKVRKTDHMELTPRPFFFKGAEFIESFIAPDL